MGRGSLKVRFHIYSMQHAILNAYTACDINIHVIFQSFLLQICEICEQHSGFAAFRPIGPWNDPLATFHFTFTFAFTFIFTFIFTLTSRHMEIQKESLFCLPTPLEHFDFHIISYWTSSHMAITTYFFKENPLLPHRLLFPISSKGSFICTFPQTGQHIPQPLMDQL